MLLIETLKFLLLQIKIDYLYFCLEDENFLERCKNKQVLGILFEGNYKAKRWFVKLSN
jgi:hypothetical protein